MAPTKMNGTTFKNPKTGKAQTRGPGGQFGKYAAHGPAATRTQLIEEQVPREGVILSGRSTRNNPILQAIGNQFVRGNPWQFIQNIQATASQSSAENLQLINSRQYYDLCDEMADKDTTIEATLNYISSAIFCRPQAFVVTDELDDQAVEMRDVVERDLTEVNGDFGWESLLHSLLIGTLRHGFSVNEIMWGFDEGRIKPLEYLHRHPGKFAFGDRGAMKYADTSGNWQEAPRGKFVLSRRPALYGNAYGRSVLFGMRYIYFFKKQAIKSWVDFADTYGMPLAHGKIPIGANNKAELRDKLIDIFESFRSEVGIVTTENEEIDFIERVKGGSGSKPAHAALVEWFSREEVRGLVGAALAMMEAEHGSRAQATTHESVNQTVIKPFAGLLETAVNRMLIRPYVDLNFGTEVPAPIFKIDTDDALDVKVAIEALSFAIEAKLPVAEREAREMLNLGVPKEGEPVLENKPDPPPPIINNVPPDPDIPVDDDGNDDDSSQRFAELPQGTGADLELEREFTEKMHRLAKAIADEHIGWMVPQFQARVAEIKLKTVGTNRLTALGAGALIPNVSAEQIEQMEAAIVTARMFAAQISAALFERGAAANAMAVKVGGNVERQRQLGRDEAELAGFTGATMFATISKAALGDVPAEYRNAIVWAVERDVMTVADVRQLAEDLHLIDPANSALFFERELRRQVLALAGSTSEQLTVGFGRVLAGATAQGLSFGEFLDAMDEHVNAGTLPGGMEGYLSNVYRTETANAYAVQRESIYDDPDLAEFIWGFEFWNPEDDGSRPSHDDMSGVIVRKGGEAHIESLGGPPWSYQCVLPGNKIQGSVTTALKSFYSGQAVEICTKSGNRLTVTVNHPVLTDRGWMRAGEIREGMNAVRDLGQINRIDQAGDGNELPGRVRSHPLQSGGALPSPNEDHPPTEIDKVFGALANLHDQWRVRVGADDFHGDARGENGHVEIVTIDRELLHDLEASFAQGRCERILPPMDSGLPLIIGLSDTTPMDGGMNASATGGPSGTALALDSGGVALHARPLQQFRFGSPPQLDAAFAETVGQSYSIDRSIGADRLHRLAGLVALDQIVKVRHFDFSGHVYDLQTESGLMIAEGLYISNCRCEKAPVIVGDPATSGIEETPDALVRVRAIERFRD